ncbi:uncharacterized protein N0V89_012499 [Didymosphaeria variabile]|uniref:Uncharacterized protein n=1 Tax=Didymosphaeria variabile TaxID=1932322 RepID=A0A9W8XAS0_9PLEO|nr:uncharacterized protein N0V89_012499 [Didymosphaeria variabile]KAJ4344755.1 hypothetical protein N0V89_012499 [Didymosphaeria variabile]
MCHRQHTVHGCAHTFTTFHPCAEKEDENTCSIGTMELERTENKFCFACEEAVAAQYEKHKGLTLVQRANQVSAPEVDKPQSSNVVKAKQKEVGADKKAWLEQLAAAAKVEKPEATIKPR